MIAGLVKENPDSIIVDSGNQSDEPFKLELIASVLSELHYDAIGVGELDLLAGEEFFKQTSEHKLCVLDASPKALPSTRPFVVKNVGGLKVGIVSFGAVQMGASTNQYERRKAFYTTFKAAREGSDILILLDQAYLVDRAWVERNCKRIGAPDVVIAGSQRTEAPRDEVVGKTHLLQTSRQAVHVGVVDIEITPGQEPKYTVQRIALEPAVGQDEAIANRVKELLKTEGQATADGPPPPVNVAANGTYVPPTLCRACHVKEYDDWALSKHAHAITTLVDQQRVLPECLRCHSEAFRKMGIVSIPREKTGGVDCMTCHGRSLPHGMERKGSGMSVKVDPKMCVGCHTPDHSARYEENAYMAKVSHKDTATSGAPSGPVTPPAMK